VRFTDRPGGIRATKVVAWATPRCRAQGTHFFLSMSTMSLLSAFSTMTGMRSGYLSRIRPASCLRFSVGARGRIAVRGVRENHKRLLDLGGRSLQCGRRRRIPRSCSCLNFGIVLCCSVAVTGSSTILVSTRYNRSLQSRATQKSNPTQPPSLHPAPSRTCVLPVSPPTAPSAAVLWLNSLTRCSSHGRRWWQTVSVARAVVFLQRSRCLAVSVRVLPATPLRGNSYRPRPRLDSIETWSPFSAFV
jgi:hypothetical protein